MIGYTPGTLIARRGLFESLGEFDPELSIACDADWFARLQDSAQPLAVVPEVMLLKRIHGANMSLQRDRVRSETMTVIRSSLLRKRGNEAGPQTGRRGVDGQADPGVGSRSWEHRA
jgi:hypothetical protein